MAYLLQIETTTQQCSVALSFKGKTLAVKEERTAGYSHSEKLHVFIQSLLEESGFSWDQIDAIAVSKGPGSYTGLRIGIAAAKGLCFAKEIPLIAINTLDIMAQAVNVESGYVIPMLDARRMEVYTAVYDHQKTTVFSTTALVLTPDSLVDIVTSHPCKVIGNGAAKFENLSPKLKASFNSEVYPSASDMSQLAWEKFQQHKVEDIAYFEPYYLKDFQTTPAKK